MSRLPGWLEPLYTADEMRALDAWAIHDEGVPSLQLMERAGAEVARVVTARAPDRPVRIVCGKGNNGGDGLVVARLLADAGLDAEALLLSDPGELSGDAGANFERLAGTRARWSRVDPAALPAALAGSDAIVDAMLGTGFEGAPRPPLDAAIDAVNGAGSPVIAVDVPSGVNAATGETEGAHVRADVTVTFHGAKVGLCVDPGKTVAGRVEVVPIGIPPDRYGAPSPGTAGLILPQARDALPARGAGSTKFSSGSVLVVGGSTGLTGAVCLACEAAMRAGAGWVRAGIPESLNPVFEVKLTEVMSVPLPDAGGALLAGATDAVLEAAERADAVALGPGLGRAGESFALALELIERIDRPLLLDADALNALAQAGLERTANRSAPTVMTPHAGELGRLLGRPSAEIAAHRLAAASEAAERSRAVVVLKGDDTLVVQPGAAPVGISRGGAGALATAGTGDVLSGVAAAFLARGLEPFRAACAAVETHREAGRAAARSMGSDSVVAGDVIAALPAALRGGSGGPA
jgi:ADP-dependent NAD(P)H-hydrate dehydratase / NAD(P)H-hydrate epimerase